MTKEWDVFISYASEDRDAAHPLAEALRARGVSAWLDVNEIGLGDSIRRSLDEGLKRSQFGVVLISKTYLRKHWPQAELGALLSKEAASVGRLLPVWHGISKRDVVRRAPLLADRFAVNTASGIEAVARAVADRVFELWTDAPTLRRRLALAIERYSGSGEFARLLASSAYQGILGRATGVSLAEVMVGVKIGTVSLDLIGSHSQPTTGVSTWVVLLFDNPDARPVDESGTVSPTIKQMLDNLSKVREIALLSPRHMPDCVSSSFTGKFRAWILCGRRAATDAKRAAHIAKVNDDAFGVSIRTYDWLLDAVERKE